MLATSYPLLDAFWTILWIFGIFLWIWLVIACFADIIRSRDLSGWAKGLWTAFIVLIPLFGVLCYLIVRGGEMHERAAEVAEMNELASRTPARSARANGSTGTADELAKLAELRDQGVISENEFQQEKANLLAS